MKSLGEDVKGMKLNKMEMMKQLITEYLKDGNITKRKIDDETEEVCDLSTGECKTIKMNDGFIQRPMVTERSIQVETTQGIKQLLMD